MKKIKVVVLFGLLGLFASCSGGGLPTTPGNKDASTRHDITAMDVHFINETLVDGQDIQQGRDNQQGEIYNDIKYEDTSWPWPDGCDTDGAGANCPGGEGCECKDNSDCYSGFCIETANGHRCAQLCDSDASCPDGYKCTSVENTGGDTVYICVYKFPKLCMPCKEDSDCTASFVPEGAMCVAWVPEVDANGQETGKFVPGYGNEGAFCGTPCENDGDCLAGYACKTIKSTSGAEAKQCVLTSGSCGCTPKASKLQAMGTCYSRNDFGTCTGTQQCGTDGTMGKCSAKEPKAEVCNHEDDNCDGQTDEGIDTQTDVNNCGDCGIKCTNDHGNTQCIQGKCVPQCDAGFWDCDGDPTNGCETDLSTVDSCGQCTRTEECPEGFSCKDGTCIKKYSNGHQCNSADECAGGYCTDEGVCCDQACDGPCQSCSGKSCKPVAQDGMPETADACGGFLCDGNGACLTECNSNADCLDNYFCEQTPGDPEFHKCKPDMDLGGDCSDEGYEACKSNFCADGVCCENPCDGSCHQCNAQGKCVQVLNAEDPDTCGDTKQCDANGECVLKNGQTCSSNNDCLSGICKDGFCCDTSCDAPCSECTATGCQPVKGRDDVPECTGDHTCNGSGQCVLKSGHTCNSDADCASGKCKADYDGTGNWCANPDQCFHDGVAYADGDLSIDCWDSTNQAKCQNGQWVKQSCGDSGCAGNCGGDVNGCEYHVMSCAAGKCQDNAQDVDTGQPMCEACGLQWSIGGDAATSSCCGDDPNEYVLHCRDSSANGDCGNDDTACCKKKNDCVDHQGNCVSTGKCYSFGTDNKKSYCDAGQWQDPDEAEPYCEASGCGYKWLSHGTGHNAKCCGDDPGENFNQLPGPGRSCCYNGKIMASGSSNGSVLCYNGHLYECNSNTLGNVSTTRNTCDQTGNMYCSSDGTWKTGKDNGCMCTNSNACGSGYCKSDYDGSGSWCADGDQCVHNGHLYNSGAFSGDCYDGTHQAKCLNGKWSASSCGTDSTCTHYICIGGSCKPQYRSSSTRCDSTYRCSSGAGDNRYNKAGIYRCQGYCDGAGHCDYAGSCDKCSDNFSHGTGTCSGDNCVLVSCDKGYANCYGGANSACETYLNANPGSCSGATSLGTVCADKSASASSSGRGNKWFKVYMKECDNWDKDLKMNITLSVPSGVDYDLYLYNGSCGYMKASTTVGNGSDESINYGWSDSWGHDNSRWFYIKVVYRNGSSCGNWKLTVTGG